MPSLGRRVVDIHVFFQAVYRAALARATQGDERAIAFLEENAAP